MDKIKVVVDNSLFGSFDDLVGMYFFKEPFLIDKTMFENYDPDKFEDGKIHEFTNLREVGAFIEDANKIRFTKELSNIFHNLPDIIRLNVFYAIDKSEENLIRVVLNYNVTYID